MYIIIHVRTYMYMHIHVHTLYIHSTHTMYNTCACTCIIYTQYVHCTPLHALSVYNMYTCIHVATCICTCIWGTTNQMMSLCATHRGLLHCHKWSVDHSNDLGMGQRNSGHSQNGNETVTFVSGMWTGGMKPKEWSLGNSFVWK